MSSKHSSPNYRDRIRPPGGIGGAGKDQRMSGKDLVAEALEKLGIFRLCEYAYGGCGSIFMLHSVLPEAGLLLSPALAAPAHILDSYLGYLRGRGIRLVGIDEAVERLKNGPYSEKFACFTLDDGYRDNLTTALPVFEKWSCPFCVYVATDFIERRLNYWWKAAEALFERYDRLEFTFQGKDFSYENATIDRKRSNLADFKKFMKIGSSPDKKEFGTLMEVFGIDMADLLDKDALNRDELGELSRHPLATVGAHTKSHGNLAGLSEKEVVRELRESREYIEEACGTPVRHLSYPYGERANAGPREFEIARQLGFASAVTTSSGTLRPEHRNHLASLPRICFLGNAGRPSGMELFRSGFHRQWAGKTLFPVTVL